MRALPAIPPHGARPSVNTPVRISSDPSTRQAPYPPPHRSTPHHPPPPTPPPPPRPPRHPPRTAPLAVSIATGSSTSACPAIANWFSASGDRWSSAALSQSEYAAISAPVTTAIP